MKKTIFLLLLCLFSAAAFAQQNITDSVRGIAADSRLDVRTKVEKIRSAMGSVQKDSREKLDIYYATVLPLIKKIRDDKAHDEEMARAYLYISGLWYNEEEMERVKGTADTTLVYAERTGNDTLRANAYKWFAQWHMFAGSVETAHEYFYKAADIYERLGKDTEFSSTFFNLASGHVQIRDYEGLEKIVKRLRQFGNGNLSKTFLYYQYQIESAYYHLMYEAFPEVEAYRDSSVLYLKNGLKIAEKYAGELDGRVEVAWGYYNVVVSYLVDFDPPQLDSVEHYLRKMESSVEITTSDENDRREMQISINDTKAWLHYYRGEYAAAERKMFEVLDLLAMQTDPNMVIPEYSEAYAFLAELYEQTGRPAAALKYQKLYNENQSKRFGEEKMYALKELNTKYEVEKKEARIDELNREKAYTQRIFLLTLGISIALLVVVVLLIAALRLRKRSAEQRLYEMALEAEQRLEELGRRKEEKMRRKSSEVITDKVRAIIESSALTPPVKRKYLDQLAALDTARLEETFSTLPDTITPMDMKYIVCFMTGIDVPDISTMLNIEPASVYTVRYRIKKKFRDRSLPDSMI